MRRSRRTCWRWTPDHSPLVLPISVVETQTVAVVLLLLPPVTQRRIRITGSNDNPGSSKDGMLGRRRYRRSGKRYNTRGCGGDRTVHIACRHGVACRGRWRLSGGGMGRRRSKGKGRT